MIPEFPTNLSHVEAKQFSRTAYPDLRQSQYDDGYMGTSPRATRIRYVHEVRYLACSVDNRNEFDRWYRYELKNGSVHFMWPNPYNKGYRQRARIVDGQHRWVPADKAYDTWLLEVNIMVYE